MDDNFNNKRTQQEIDSSTNSKRYRTFAPDSISRNKQLQLDIISQLKYENKGTESRIVSGKWYVQWEGYCLDIQTRPSSVNNSTIMDANNRLKEGLDEGRDYYVVPIEAWRKLHCMVWLD
ncbi:hypothetical protein BD560DRAFT_110181 [Blakeslea trispora]|nr:hypothetical protein BD560DRAFT_110181 [Blakeslea trispora]